MVDLKKASKQGRNNRVVIIETAMDLFAEKGFDGTSMREIARSAEVALSLITQFFGTKEKLHVAVDDYVLNEFSTQIKNILDEQNFFEKSYKASVAFIVDHQRQYSYIRRALVDGSPSSDKFFKRYHKLQVNVIRRGKQLGVVAEDVDERWAGMILIFLVLGPIFCMHQIEAITGKSVFDSKSIMQRNDLYARMLQQGLGSKK